MMTNLHNYTPLDADTLVSFPSIYPGNTDGMTSVSAQSVLPEGFIPGSFIPGMYDVICQRGKESFEHVGNKRFRELIEKHISAYMGAKSRQSKSNIVTKIYDQIRDNAPKPSSGFVKKNFLTRRWLLVCEKEARDKVGQALRDAIKVIRTGCRGVKGDQERKRKENVTSQLEEVKSISNTPKKHSMPVRMAIQRSQLDRKGGNLQNVSEEPNHTPRRLADYQLGLPFPIAAGPVFGVREQLQASQAPGMLECTIEPIDLLQQHENTPKRRRLSTMSQGNDFCNSSVMVSWNLDDMQILNQHSTEEKLIRKRSLQQSGGTVETLRRLSFIDSESAATTLSNRVDPFFGQRKSDNNMAGFSKAFPSSNFNQQSTYDALPPYSVGNYGPSPTQLYEDILEPTPLSTSDQQRADILTHLARIL